MGEAEGDGVADGQPDPTAEPQTQPPNGVSIPPDMFQEKVDYVVAYNFFVQLCLSREATDDYLHQRRNSGACRTPHALNSMVQASVSLATTTVDCCSLAAWLSQKTARLTPPEISATPHGTRPITPHKQAAYWPLLPWRKMMLADSAIGPGMVQAMKDAREAAGTSPVDGLGDWFHGATFRKLVELGCFLSNTCIALSISTDGFQASPQRGFEGCPIIATKLNVDASTRVPTVSQFVLGITPGPGQPAEL